MVQVGLPSEAPGQGEVELGDNSIRIMPHVRSRKKSCTEVKNSNSFHASNVTINFTRLDSRCKESGADVKKCATSVVPAGGSEYMQICIGSSINVGESFSFSVTLGNLFAEPL